MTWRDAIANHPGLAWMKTHATARPWFEQMPGTIDALAKEWQLAVDAPFGYMSTSAVLAVRCSDGTNAVLKLAWPHEEATYEADALIAWDGNGAVRLLAHDRERSAMLLERCEPGTELFRAGPDEALEVGTELLARLWIPAGRPFKTLADEAAWWSTYVAKHWEDAGRPFESELIDATMEALTELPSTQPEQVLLHQDLHGRNILKAEREPWLAVDPKPLVGEKAFGLAPMIRDFEFGHSEQAVVARLDRLAEGTCVDRERARHWALAQTMAWSFDSAHIASHIETARWLARA